MYNLVIIIVVRKMLFILLTVIIFNVVEVQSASKCHYLIIIITTSYFTDITVHPQSVNNTLNSTVNFTCEAVAEDIVFRVNDISAANVNINKRGFTQQAAYNLNDGKLRRVLIAEAFEDNNNTNISCRAYGSCM